MRIDVKQLHAVLAPIPRLIDEMAAHADRFDDALRAVARTVDDSGTVVRDPAGFISAARTAADEAREGHRLTTLARGIGTEAWGRVAGSADVTPAPALELALQQRGELTYRHMSKYAAGYLDSAADRVRALAGEGHTTIGARQLVGRNADGVLSPIEGITTHARSAPGHLDSQWSGIARAMDDEARAQGVRLGAYDAPVPKGAAPPVGAWKLPLGRVDDVYVEPLDPIFVVAAAFTGVGLLAAAGSQMR